MKAPTIEIHGTGSVNRGAELMTIAIAERLRGAFPGVRLVVPPRFGDFISRGRYGLYTTDNVGGRRAQFIARLATPDFRKHSGMLPVSEVDAVLDASGFAFSDQWGEGRAIALLRKMDEPARAHQPLILLPQALGPFEVPAVRDACRRLFERASLVCARDSRSFEAAEQLGGTRRLKKYPDFTIPLHPFILPGTRPPTRYSLIVPNVRMLDKTSKGESYLQFLEQAISILTENHLNPAFLMHDSAEDMQVIERVNRIQIPVLEHSDPRVLKGILGGAVLVIGSRFHALVSALSQGVPCIAAGWSHKYSELMADFDTANQLISDLNDHAKLRTLIEELSSVEVGNRVRERIQAASEKLKSQTNNMWLEVEQLLREAIPHLEIALPGAAPR